ncbi:MAG: hypothetical protein ABWY25_09510 [Paenisporosarcina sp.]
MPTFYGAVDLAKNELRNVVFQNLGSAPSTPVKGQAYMNSADNTLYWYDGSQWIAAKGGAGAVPADTVTTQAVGDTAVPGSSALYSRGDHKHAREGFGVVTAETTFGSASNNGSAVTVSRSDHVHGNPVHDAAAHSAIPLSSLAIPTVDLNLNNRQISNLNLIPVNGGDATSKSYVDNLIAGLSWKDSCRIATTANITLSGNQSIDGVTTNTGDRVLVKNQTTASTNGIYLAGTGAWARATDVDTSAEVSGLAVYIEEGTTLNGTAWTLTTDPPITLGSTNLSFAQFGGGTTYIGGAGLTLTGATFDIVAADSSITVNPDNIAVNTGIIATVASLTAAVTGMAKKFAAALTGTSSPETVTHNLNTRDIALTVYNGATPYTAVEVDWDATTVNTAVVRYNPNLGSGYRVVVFG